METTCHAHPQCGDGRHGGVVRVELLVGWGGLDVVGCRVGAEVIVGEGGSSLVSLLDVLVVGVGGVVAVAGLVVTMAWVGVLAAGRPSMTSSGVPRSGWIPRLKARAAIIVPAMTAPPRAASGGRGASVRRVSVTGRRTARHVATSLTVRGTLRI